MLTVSFDGGAAAALAVDGGRVTEAASSPERVQVRAEGAGLSDGAVAGAGAEQASAGAPAASPPLARCFCSATAMTSASIALNASCGESFAAENGGGATAASDGGAAAAVPAVVAAERWGATGGLEGDKRGAAWGAMVVEAAEVLCVGEVAPVVWTDKGAPPPPPPPAVPPSLPRGLRGGRFRSCKGGPWGAIGDAGATAGLAAPPPLYAPPPLKSEFLRPGGR